MRKHGNKVQYTVTVDEKVAEVIEDYSERFGCSASAVVEVCVLAERDSLRQIERLVGREGFNKVVRLLKWWKERPGAFDGFTGELKEVEG